MALTTITARVDAGDKAALDKFGLPPSAPDPFFSEENLAYVKKSVAELRTGKGTAHELIEVDDQ